MKIHVLFHRAPAHAQDCGDCFVALPFADPTQHLRLSCGRTQKDQFLKDGIVSALRQDQEGAVRLFHNATQVQLASVPAGRERPLCDPAPQSCWR
jgi:hypothetical protein